MLGTYHRGLYFEKIGQFKRAAKEYQNAYTKAEIGDLTKNYILDRAEALKSKKKNQKRMKLQQNLHQLKNLKKANKSEIKGSKRFNKNYQDSEINSE